MQKAILIKVVGLTIILAAVALGQPQVVLIPQVADGGAWQTTLVLANTTTGSASATLNFFQETTAGATQSWNLGFVEGPSQNVSLSAGATTFLHTLGTISTTTVGWGQIIASPGVTAYAIFTQRVPGRTDQDGTAPGGPGAERILVPFDNSPGFVTSMAIVNPLASSEVAVVNIQTDAGAISHTSITLPAQGHLAFVLPQQLPATDGRRGLAEFYVARGSLSIIALRASSTGAFTTSPVYNQSGAAIIGSSPILGK